MKISKLIEQLQTSQEKYGDLRLTDYSGFITQVKITAAKDGVVYTKDGPPSEYNELSIEMLT